MAIENCALHSPASKRRLFLTRCRRSMGFWSGAVGEERPEPCPRPYLPRTVRQQSWLRTPRRVPVVLRTRLGSPEILVSTHPVVVAADIDDVAVVQQAVDERRGHHLVAEHLTPFLEALVRGQHRRCLLVSGVDQLKNSTAPSGSPEGSRSRRQPSAPGASAPACGGQLAGCLGFRQRLHQPRQPAEVDPPPRLGGRDIPLPCEEPELAHALDLMALCISAVATNRIALSSPSKAPPTSQSDVQIAPRSA